MDDFMRGIYYTCWRRGVVAIIVFFYLLIFTSTGCFCCESADNQNLAGNIVLKASFNDMESVKTQFDQLERLVDVGSDPAEKSCQFLKSFIDQVNNQYRLSLSVTEACQLVKSNLDQLQISPEERASLLIAVDLLEKNESRKAIVVQEQSLQISKAHARRLKLYWPWQWNWFGLNKQHQQNKPTKSLQLNIANIEAELPGNCYAGACEAFAGALLCIIPHPIAWSAGIAMIADGGRRVVEGVIQVSDERRLDSNYQRPRLTDFNEAP